MRSSIGLFVAAALSASAPAGAGTYLQSQGDLNYSTGLGYLKGSREWDGDGNLRRAGCDSRYTFLSQYLDYGYSYYHSLFGGVNLANLRCGPDSKTGLGDITVGVRGRLDVTRNNRAWELSLNIPTSSQTTGSTRLGCGAFAVHGSVGTREEITPNLDLGGEIGVQLWESPLSHQLDADVSLGGDINRQWKWKAGLDGNMPLDPGSASVDTAASDCGTAGKRVRGSLGLGFVPRRDYYVGCELSLTAWGRDTTRREGVFCAFSRLFKR